MGYLLCYTVSRKYNGGDFFMSEKSIYKKATGEGWEYNPDTARAKENKFFNEISSDKVGKKKKVQAKRVDRSDHKHKYSPVIVWGNSWRNKARKVFHTASVCPICGREGHFNFCAYFCLFICSVNQHLSISVSR